jgi:hypothetical protein
MKIKYGIAIIGCTSWCGLGFIRGVNSYKYNNNIYDKNETFIYSTSILHGIFGLALYGNPILLPFFIHKEIYRLETDLRNLENEKKSSYYNNIIF